MTRGERGANAPPLALTMGDPAGIGPEITLKAWMNRGALGLKPFAVYGDPGVYESRARLFGMSVPIATITDPHEANSAFPTALPVLAIPLATPAKPGAPDSANASVIIAAIERAVETAATGQVRAVVTNPIAKSVLYGAGFPHPGHTEFLAALAAKHWPGKRHQHVMMLASDELRAVPLTIHVPLAHVPQLITKTLIADGVRITWEALKRDFGIEHPRIAVAGLNPHAGEGGALGEEDMRIIAPAIKDLQREGLAVTGPHSADTLFHAARRRTYDAVVAMYHDQALIPLKTLAFDEGVNITLGLPFVRTSPDHGTAFDIAAAGNANPLSLMEALKVADQMAQRRASHAA